MRLDRTMFGEIGRHLFPQRETCVRVLHQLTQRDPRKENRDNRSTARPSSPQQRIPQSRKLHKEAYYRDKLVQELHGKTEVQTPNGRKIDIVTQTTIIEVTHVKGWKSALGQITAYGHYYPRHQKRVHLFGEKTSVNAPHIEGVCRANGVLVTWEDDL